MRRALVAAAAAFFAAAAPAVPASAAPRDSRLRSVQSFGFAIGTGALDRPLGAYDLLVVDGVEASRARVRQLHRHGALVLAYVDVGTIERGRPWSGAARPFRLDRLEEWDEWYADVNARGYRRLIAARVAPRLLRKGFDGLFLDNTDMIETHRARRRGMRALVRSLARLDGLLFTQNGEGSIGRMLRLYDGWNREDLSFTYDFDSSSYKPQPAAATRSAQRALRRIARAGLLVTATDYLPDGSDPAAAVANACAAGALPFVSDIGLTRVPAEPLHC